MRQELLGGPPLTQKKMPDAARDTLGNGDGTGYVDDGDEYGEDEEYDSESSERIPEQQENGRYIINY